MSEQNPRIVVGTIIYNEKNQIFLTKSPKWENRWVIPGGHLDLGETLEECARREVKEETNIDIDNLECLGFQEAIFPKDYNKKKHMILFDYCGKATSENIILNEEHTEYKWFKIEDALQLDFGGYTKEAILKFIEKKKVG